GATVAVVPTDFDGLTRPQQGNAFDIGAFAIVPVIGQASSTLSVTSSVNPAVFSQAVTFTATVAAVGSGLATPSGTVTFKDGSVNLGTATLSNGTATFTTAVLVPGTHSISSV